MKDLTLYVKSRKISIGTNPSVRIDSHGGYLGSSSGTLQKSRDYSPKDKEAVDLLNQTKITYHLIDLSNLPFTTRLKLVISGIKTPTLILNNKKISGVENIRQALKDFAV